MKIMKNTGFLSYSYVQRIRLLFIIFPFILACSQKTDVDLSDKDAQDDDPIRGVWELHNHYWVKDGDTLFLAPDEIEVKHKIYLDGYVIWSEDPITDSLEWHGYGTYRLDNETLIEKVISTSFPMQAEMGTSDEIIYQIEIGEGLLKQTTERLHRGMMYQSIEEWKKLD
jgi:hypothetical protein